MISALVKLYANQLQHKSTDKTGGAKGVGCIGQRVEGRFGKYQIRRFPIDIDNQMLLMGSGGDGDGGGVGWR